MAGLGAAEPPASVDQPTDVFAGVGVVVDGGLGQPGGGVAGGFGGLGGVLGQVARHRGVGNLPLAGHGEMAGVELLAPGHGPALRPVRMRGSGEGDAGRGVADRVFEHGGIHPRRCGDDRLAVVGVAAVEAECDGAAVSWRRMSCMGVRGSAVRRVG